ncbi:MAG: M48 family metalloprotease [bacterium]|nr:M48 family metalloprotease [bacterium]
MNFHHAQDLARRNTGWLVLLFGLAVAGIMAAAVAAVLLALKGTRTWSGQILSGQEPGLALAVALAVLTVIVLGSLLKLRQLAGGGRTVAEGLGGRRVHPSSQDPQLRKLLNVVEEMALAAGIPVPAVFLLDEPAINAFAAGWTPADAVIGVTRGAVESLSRDELQGVVAHEISHITGGDMARNLHLAGTLHGILLLGLTGEFVLRHLRGVRLGGTRGRGGVGSVGAALGLAALALLAVGYIGSFFGNLIKALISRQREFHADAAAVQYTRHPAGLAGALKRIGGAPQGSLLRTPNASEFSHAYFSLGVKASLRNPLATHPPLAERVRRLDPDWDGRWQEPLPRARNPAPLPAAAGRPAAAAPVRRLLSVSAALEALDQAGQADTRSLGYARGLLGRLPPDLAGESQDPLGAQALLLALAADATPEARQRQLVLVRALGAGGLADLADKLVPPMQALAPELRLPLVDLALATLHGLSRPQALLFRQALLELIEADQAISLREWLLQRLVLHHLDGAHGLGRRPPAHRGNLVQAAPSARLLLTALARLEHEDEEGAARAFAAGCREAALPEEGALPPPPGDGRELEAAMEELGALPRPDRIRLMRGAMACGALDNQLTPDGLFLIRILARGLDLPMPLLVPRKEREAGA